MEINTESLKNKVDKLTNLITEYEEIELNIFNQLKNCLCDWQDDNSIQFENAMYLEKKEADMILEVLKNKVDLYKYIYERYSEIGKKIKCNLGNKNAILRSITYCCNYATQAINEFNRVDMSFSYREKSAIKREKEKIVSLRKELINIKDSLINTYDKIQKIEIEIKTKAKKLEELRITNFDFSLV